LGYIRDWYKKTKIDEELIFSVGNKTNQYDNLTDLHKALTANKNELGVAKLFDSDNGIRGSREGVSSEYIIINKNSYNMTVHSFDSITTQNDLQEVLDNFHGKFRPIFNLFCTTGESESCSYWLSPNMYTKDGYGFPYDNDEIHLVIFCEKYTLSIYQEQENGDKAFESYLQLIDKLLT